MTATRRVKPPEPSERERSNLERDLRTVMRRYRAREAAFAQATEERDRVIRDALGTLPRAVILEETGLSAQRIDQIRRGARL